MQYKQREKFIWNGSAIKINTSQKMLRINRSCKRGKRKKAEIQVLH